jgi:hypothetical protein
MLMSTSFSDCQEILGIRNLSLELETRTKNKGEKQKQETRAIKLSIPDKGDKLRPREETEMSDRDDKHRQRTKLYVKKG